ncbi:hypothetical protein HDU85_007503 [Gaertneriomyces sp. JEL0708]|nr:hypothetical protein HDU85_007503 [Gaertneriomyces sp. JEL0708]
MGSDSDSDDNRKSKKHGGRRRAGGDSSDSSPERRRRSGSRDRNQNRHRKGSGNGDDEISSRLEKTRIAGDDHGGSHGGAQRGYGSTGAGHSQQSQGGYGQQCQGGYGQQSNGGYGQQSQGGYGQQTLGGHGQQSQGGYGQQTQGGYGQQNKGGYGQQSNGGYGQQSHGGYGQQSNGGYGQQSNDGYGQQSNGGYGQQSNGGYGQQSQGAHQQPNQGGHCGSHPVQGCGTTLKYSPLDFLGPLLRFHDIDPYQNLWTGSILIVAQRRPASAPVCTYSDGVSPPVTAPLRELATFENAVFYRFDLKVKQKPTDTAITYIINGDQRYTFHVPAIGSNCRVFGMSCNGFSSDVTDPNASGGMEPMWKDVLRRHRESPFHVMLGGGDQVYMDAVFTSNDEILEWLRRDGRDAKSCAPFDDKMRQSVMRFAFGVYMNHFRTPAMKDALATIPYIFQWDDHDIWDGYGSYPSWLQDCPVFHGMYEVMRHFYLLFQQHTTDANRVNEEPIVFGANGSYSSLRHLGPDLAVLAIDTRSERQLDQIASPPTWNAVFDTVGRRLNPGTKHLIVMCAIPIVWPRLTAADAVVSGLQDFLAFAGTKLSAFAKIPSAIPGIAGLGEAIGKTGLYKNILGVFGEPELADDLCDHWTAKAHLEERKHVIERFQELARARNVRINFLSGDVHCCGAGWFRSKQQTDGPAGMAARSDHKAMWQITSSAIINVPPPGIVIGMLHNNAGPFDLDASTVDEMLDVFNEDVDGSQLKQRKVLARRNYCSAEYRNGELFWQIHAERVDRNQDAKRYPISVPSLKV